MYIIFKTKDPIQLYKSCICRRHLTASITTICPEVQYNAPFINCQSVSRYVHMCRRIQRYSSDSSFYLRFCEITRPVCYKVERWLRYFTMLFVFTSVLLVSVHLFHFLTCWWEALSTILRVSELLCQFIILELIWELKQCCYR